MRRLAWFAHLAIDRLRSDPRTFPGAVLRAARGMAPRPLQRLLVGAAARRRHSCTALPADLPPLVRGDLVSVVLPVFNQADTLGAAVDSVLAQRGVDLELLLLDDGSSDDVVPVLTHAASDRRCRVLRQRNQRLPLALSHAFAFARGRYLTWTSADNLLQPDCLRTLVDHLQRHRDTAMVYADYAAIDAAGRPLRGTAFRPLQRTSPDSAIVRIPRDTELLNVQLDNFIGPCFLYRGFVQRCLGAWTGALGVEDYDYWMRLNAAFRIEHLGTDATPYLYRWHANSLNARAATIGLLERGRALMQHEAKRAAWRRRPWRITIDPALAAWAIDASFATTHGGAAKHLVLLAPTTWQSAGATAALFTVVCWSGDAALARRCAARADAPDTLHVTTDPDVAAALDAVTARVLLLDAARRGDVARLATACADAATADQGAAAAAITGDLPAPWLPHTAHVVVQHAASPAATAAANACAIALRALGCSAERSADAVCAFDVPAVGDGDAHRIAVCTHAAAIAANAAATAPSAVVLATPALLAAAELPAAWLPRTLVLAAGAAALPELVARLAVWMIGGGEPAAARAWCRLPSSAPTTPPAAG